MARKVATTVRHTAIEIDPRFPEDTFTFVPPEAAQLVDRFGPPGRSLGKAEFVGKPAPGFALEDIEGKETHLADFEGKVLIVNFWATWCSSCRREIATLISFQSQYAAQGFSVIGISTDGAADVVQSFAQKHKLNFPLLMADAKVREDYGNISAIPTTFVIDRKGIVRYSYVGTPSDMLSFQRHVEKLLAE